MPKQHMVRDVPVVFRSASDGLLCVPVSVNEEWRWSAGAFDEDNSLPSYRGGRKAMVVVGIWVYDKQLVRLTHVSEGRSYCSHSDKFNFRKGVNIALGRALKQIAEYA